MTDDRIPAEAITVALAALKKSGYAVPSREVMEAAIRKADEARGLREQRIRCGCDKGSIEAGPAGATYSSTHERCKGAGMLVRLIGPERPYWRPVERGS